MDSGILRRAAVFHAVGLTGGITAASRQLGKSPPAVHADLRRFEREMGIALTERAGRTLRLTRPGREIFAAVARALAEIEQACAAAHRTVPRMTPLRLGAVTGFGRYRLVPQLLEQLDREQRLVLITDTHEALLAKLDAQEIDLVVTYRPVTAAPLRTVPLAMEEIALVGARHAGRIDEAARGLLPFVTYDEYEYVFARWFAEAAGGQPAVLRRHDHFSELEEALASVAAGRGVTIAPVDACTAAGLEPFGPVCSNVIHLCGTAAALDTPEADMVAAIFHDDQRGKSGIQCPGYQATN